MTTTAQFPVLAISDGAWTISFGPDMRFEPDLRFELDLTAESLIELCRDAGVDLREEILTSSSVDFPGDWGAPAGFSAHAAIAEARKKLRLA